MAFPREYAVIEAYVTWFDIAYFRHTSNDDITWQFYMYRIEDVHNKTCSYQLFDANANEARGIGSPGQRPLHPGLLLRRIFVRYTRKKGKGVDLSETANISIEELLKRSVW